MTNIIKPTDYDPQRDGTAFCYFMDDPCFPCHPTGSHWNGFANVRVSPQVRDLIATEWRETTWGNDTDEITDLLAIAPDADGLIDLSNGYATELEPEPSMTLDQFRATAREVDDLGVEHPGLDLEGVKGRIYVGQSGPYIEVEPDGYALTLGNQQWVTDGHDPDQLADLEAELYQWARSENCLPTT